MPWLFAQDGKGLAAPDGEIIDENAYAGKGIGVNNPEYQHVVKTGPLPIGRYHIGKDYQHPRLGSIVMNLDPLPGTEQFGRSAFRIHGDNRRGDRSGSEGCIVTNRAVREMIANSPDRIMEVVETFEVTEDP